MPQAILAIPPGAKCLKPSQAATKFGRRETWIWNRLKSDPSFPRPIYLGAKAPVFVEQHLDEYLAVLAGKVAA